MSAFLQDMSNFMGNVTKSVESMTPSSLEVPLKKKKFKVQVEMSILTIHDYIKANVSLDLLDKTKGVGNFHEHRSVENTAH